MAILDPRGVAIAGFGISTTTNRLSAKRVQHLVKLLRSEVAFVEAALRDAEDLKVGP